MVVVREKKRRGEGDWRVFIDGVAPAGASGSLEQRVGTSQAEACTLRVESAPDHYCEKGLRGGDDDVMRSGVW